MRTTARQMFYQETQGRKRPLSWEREEVGVHQMVGEDSGEQPSSQGEQHVQKSAAREGKAPRRTCGRVSVAGMDGVWSSTKQRWAKARCLSDLIFVTIFIRSCGYISQWAPGAHLQELPVPDGDTGSSSDETQAGLRVAQRQREAKLETSSGAAEAASATPNLCEAFILFLF